MFEYTSEVLKTWVTHSFKNKRLIFFFLLLEFSTIWIEVIMTIKRLLMIFNGATFIPSDDSKISKLSVINPLMYIQELTIGHLENVSECSESNCTMDNSTILKISGVTIGLLLFHHFICKMSFKKKDKINLNQNGEDSKLLFFINFLLINLLDIIFKILSIFCMYILLNKIIISLYLEIDTVFVVISGICLVFFILCYFYQVSYIFLYFKFDSKDTFQYDNFSKSYDLVILFIKFIVCLNKNLIFIKNDFNKVLKFTIFFDYLLIFLLFNLTYKIFRETMINKTLSIVTNLNLNIIRLFFLTYLCLYITFFTFFNFLSVYHVSITIILVFIVTLSIITTTYKNILTHLYSDEKLIYQITFLLNLLLTDDHENPEFEKEIIKIKTLHNLNCNLNCRICRSQEIKSSHHNLDEEKLNFMSTMFKIAGEKNLTSNFSQEENELFTILHVVFNYSLTLFNPEISKIPLIYNVKDLLEKNSDKNKIFYFNLYLLFGKINKPQSESNIKKFEIVKKYDISLIKMNRSIEIIEDVVMAIDTKLKKDLYPLTSELNTHKHNIVENLSQIFQHKNLHNDTFSFVMTRYVVEKTFNIDSGAIARNLNEAEEFESKLDLIDDKICKDSLIISNYKVGKDQLLITRASKNFVKYKGKNLEEIFPIIYRTLGRQNILESINSNNDNFDFNFPCEIKKGFISSIKLETKIFRSFDFQELFLFSNFDVVKDEVMAFEVPINYENVEDPFDHKNGALVTFSENLENAFMLTPRILELFNTSKLQKKNISFLDIFVRNKITENLNTGDQQKYERKDRKSKSKDDDYLIDYYHFYNNFLIEVEKNTQVMENEEIVKKLNELKFLANGHVKVNAKVQYLYQFRKNTNKEIFVFSVKLNKRKKYNINDPNQILKNGVNDNINDMEDAMDIIKEDGAQLNSVVSQNLNDIKTQGTASVSSVATTSSALNMSILNTFTFKGKKTNLSSQNNMTGFRFTLLLINISLGIYCIIFLIIGFGSNDKMTELIDIKFNFNSFERNFYQGCLSLFYNVGIYSKGSTDMSEYQLNSYWNKFKDVGLTINMGEYVNSELRVKAGLLIDKLSYLQHFIYDSYFADTLENIFNFNTTHSIIAYTPDNDIKLNTVDTNFFDTIVLFISNAKASAFETINTMIYIFNYDIHTKKYDFSTIVDKKFTSAQKAVYEIIFNFHNYHNNLNKIWGGLENLFKDEVNSIFNLNLILTFVLVGLHVFLILVSSAIINFLKTNTTETNFVINKLVQGDWVIYLQQKLGTMRDLLHFYKIDPIRASRKLRKDQRDSLKKSKEKQTQSEQDIKLFGSKFNDGLDNDAQINIGNLISPLVRVLIYLFSFYLIYSFAFILLFEYSYTQIMLTSDYDAQYLVIEKGIMNSIMLLQCILPSNQTDYSLEMYLKENSNFLYKPDIPGGYIHDMIEDAKLHKKYIKLIERNNPEFSRIEEEANSFSDCEYLYRNVNDEVLNITKLNYPDGVLVDNLIKLCNHYKIMKQKKFSNVVEEAYFLAKKIIINYNYTYGDYTKMKQLNDLPEFFDEFTISALIIRPIQEYLLTHSIHDITIEKEQFYLICVITFMIGNILVECLIFIVINRKLIRRVLTINEEIRCLTLCIAA
jgi:hypothetical protein